MNASVTATAEYLLPFGVGVNASASTTLGTSVSKDYHYMHGHHEDINDAEGRTDTKEHPNH